MYLKKINEAQRFLLPRLPELRTEVLAEVETEKRLAFDGCWIKFFKGHSGWYVFEGGS